MLRGIAHPREKVVSDEEKARLFQFIVVASVAN